jgi:hypothetical protein
MITEKIYTAVVSLTVAFLSISFTEKSKLSPVQFLWIVTLFFVVRDWIYNKRERYIGAPKWFFKISILYCCILIALPLTHRLIEKNILSNYWYFIPIIMYALLSITSYIILWDIAIKNNDTRSGEYSNEIVTDIFTIAIYTICIFVFQKYFPDGPTEKSVIMIGIVVVILENSPRVFRTIGRLLKDWILSS